MSQSTCNPTSCQIVWGHFNFYSVPYDNFDIVSSHVPTGLTQDNHPITVKPYTEHYIGEGFSYFTLKSH